MFSLKSITVAAISLAALGGCGVGMSEDFGTGSGEDEMRRVTQPASIAVAPGTISLGQTLTISLDPGGYANTPLFFNWVCYQNGAQVSHDGTYELHDAVELGIPGYSFADGRYHWQTVFEALQSYTGGAANCDAFASSVNRKGQWTIIAKVAFAAQ